VADTRHSGAGRNPGGEPTSWIPAFAGMTLEDFTKTDSLNLGECKVQTKSFHAKAQRTKRKILNC
jgi:hypothetical protein